MIGIPGLTLDHFERGLARGCLPGLAGLAQSGTLSPLRSPVPPLSTAAWATLSSGAMPGDHGLLTDDEPYQGGFRAAGQASWRVEPLWAQLADAGIATASLCWPGTLPGAAWRGRHIDRRFAQPAGLTRADWPLPLDVAPATLRPALRALRVHPGEIPEAMAAPLIGDHAVTTPAIAELARMASIQAAAELLLDQTDTDCWLVQLDWLTALTAAIGASSPADLPDAAWFLLDRSIARLLAKLPATAAVMLLSVGATGAGLLLRRGAGIAANERRAGGSTLAVAPAIRSIFGITGAPMPIEAPAAPLADPADMARLATFGFVPAPAPAAWQLRRKLAEAELLLATDPARTIVLANDVVAASGDAIMPLGLIAAALVAIEDYAPLPDLAARIAAIAPGHVWPDLIHGVWHAHRGELVAARPYLERAASTGHTDTLLRVAAAWLMLDRPHEATHGFRQVLARAPSSPAALAGVLSTGTLTPREAEPLLRRLLAIEPDHREARSALRKLLAATTGEVTPRSAGE